MVCDTNILIYAAEPQDFVCSPYVERPDAMIASITRIEVLGFPGFASLASDRQQRLQALVSSTFEVALDEEIIQRTIALRQQKKMSLGDAIIAATAMAYGVPLVTRNDREFRHLPDLAVINPFSQ